VQNETVPSGGSRLRTNVAWARFYLVQEGLLDSSERGVWSLTERGRSARLTLSEAGAIFRKWVQVFEERRRNKESSTASVSDLSSENAPGDSGLADSIQSRLIDLLVNKLSPAGFERLSQRLLREAGFVQVLVTGRAGDGGIDGRGILQINPLVSFRVLFQCKRYKGSVSSPQVRDFQAAMAGRADKGIIITTGTFTADARREASRDGAIPIELIDGEKLVEMFKRFELGLKPVTNHEIDESFFEEFKS